MKRSQGKIPVPWKRAYEPNRPAFTLIEVLVVIAILGLLLSLGMAGINRARDAANRTECANNLRQIGIALENHQSQYRSLPQDGQNGYGYLVFILPELDQLPLYNQIQPLSTPLSNPSAAVPNQTNLTLKLFRCFSDPNSKKLTSGGFGRSNYLGSADIFTEATDLTTVFDGESTTISVGETTSEQAWALPGTATTTTPPNRGGRFGSNHRGGANFLMCDGAVKFINENIDAATFRALGTPRGNDAVGEF
jgi:prepilin-type N-terminal cleavage/methylation domain-containing protein/prepilin-type processing-associated H-X9-DG protein